MLILARVFLLAPLSPAPTVSPSVAVRKITVPQTCFVLVLKKDTFLPEVIQWDQYLQQVSLLHFKDLGGESVSVSSEFWMIGPLDGAGTGWYNFHLVAELMVPSGTALSLVGHTIPQIGRGIITYIASF